MESPAREMVPPVASWPSGVLVIVATAALGVFGWRLGHADTGDGLDTAIVALIVIVTVGLVAGGMARLLGLKGSVTLGLVAIAAGAIAAVRGVAAPAYVTWDDGCNQHGGPAPLVAVPYLSVAKPPNPFLTYGTYSTLALCTPA